MVLKTISLNLLWHYEYLYFIAEYRIQKGKIMIIDYRTIGIKFRQARKQLGLSQEELSFRCNLTREYISLIENGKKCPSLEILLILMNNLCLDFQDVFEQDFQTSNLYDIRLLGLIKNSKDVEKNLYITIIHLIKDYINKCNM